MKTIQAPIDRVGSRDVVASLYDVLQLLLDRGYVQPPESSAEELRLLIDGLQFELESGAFGDVTERLLLHFQPQADLPDLRVEWDDPGTAARLEDILASLRTLRQGRSRTVRGYITDADETPTKEKTVCLFARHLAKALPLGEATTDLQGYYEVTFAESRLGALTGEQTAPKVFIGVFDDCGQQMAQSRTVRLARDENSRLDLALSRGWTYLPYDKDDQTCFGCDAVVRSEWSYIRQRRLGASMTSGTDVASAGAVAPPNLCGIALSGGGVRSASFCLGILQALSYAGWLKSLDYISTVSGGSYIGGSLAWLLHEEWKGEQGEPIPYGVNRDDFPFGSYPMVGMSGEGASTTNPGRGGHAAAHGSASASLPHAQPWDVYKGRILGYLRQHASYLTPGEGIDVSSLLAVVLRNSLFSIVAYGGLLVAAFVILGPLLFSDSGDVAILPSFVDGKLNLALATALAFGELSLFLALAYPIVSFFISLGDKASTGYCWRYGYEKWGGRLLVSIALLAILGVLPHVHDWVRDLVAAPSPSQAAKGLGEQFVDLIKEHVAPVIGAISTLLGGLTTLFGYFRGEKKGVSIPAKYLIPVGAACLVFGLLLLSYSLAITVRGENSDWNSFRPVGRSDEQLRYFALGLFIFFGVLRFANLNYLSMHRYYRDRLMETFTPDLPDALSVNGPIPGATKSADRTELASIAGNFCPKQEAKATRPLGPYPIINANIVLVSSQIPKFRGRGGDNFILTPLYCGSNATGWCSTRDKRSPFNDMTLPTAIATSGAAIDPNTGCGGEGATRSALLSFLMGFFNVRLGYWADNPTPPGERRARKWRYKERGDKHSEPPGAAHSDGKQADDKPKGPTWGSRFAAVGRLRPIAGNNAPNVFYPGLTELWLRRNLDENSRMVQLSDGGHFENLGLYELVRRRLRLIIACDGAAHPDFDFGDLGNAIEKIRADFGALIRIRSQDLKALTPAAKDGAKTPGYASRGYLVAPIEYNDGAKGTLIYMTSTFFKELSVDLHAYRAAHEEFPNQSTADQFFDEKQFEAYRELGYQTAYEMMKDEDLVVQRLDVMETVGIPAIKCYVGITP